MAADLATLVGTSRTSPWFTVEQGAVTAFGELTGDRNPLHLDPVWCAQHSPFGRTIAHGFYTTSLLVQLAADAGPLDLPAGMVGLNYGFDRLRLVAPVPVGSRVRGVFTVASIEPRGDGQLQLKQNVEVQVEGAERPALVAEWLTMLVGAPA
ncbi:MAG TPA: MaoC family dehydratase [Candidatus Sulfotelmatobacter sp.]|nr:MaoC family dehydratase [Candidatus Sulfotelmatobacter sp.]